MSEIRRFPQDCKGDCEYFKCWDLSIDDLTCVCKKLNRQIDLCDCRWNNVECPLGIEKEEG